MQSTFSKYDLERKLRDVHDAIKSQWVQTLQECVFLYGNEIFQFMVQHQRLEELKFMLDNHCTCEKMDELFHLACEQGNVHIVKELLRTGPQKTRMCIANAASNNLMTVVELLHAYNFPLSEEALSWAAQNGHTTMVKWLLEHHCPISPDLMVDACTGGYLDVVELLFEHDVTLYENAIEAACSRGFHDVYLFVKEKCEECKGLD